MNQTSYTILQWRHAHTHTHIETYTQSEPMLYFIECSTYMLSLMQTLLTQITCPHIEFKVCEVSNSRYR